MRQTRTEERNASKHTDKQIEAKEMSAKQPDAMPATDKEEDTSVIQSSSDPPPPKSGTPQPESPSKKRALEEPSAGEEPTTKKFKEDSPSPHNGPIMPPTADSLINKETWQGFCEIESEPAYFSAILRDIGVRETTVREVFALTPDLLAMLPQPIYGLILLFRYREFGNEDQATDCPSDVWFANQLPGQNSCGTLAMINILMNSAEVEVGEHLAQFKEFTNDMSPFQRGEAFASFDLVKKIHNSFAKRMDLLENDKYLSHKAKRAQRLKDPSYTDTTTTSTKPTKAAGAGTKSRPRRPSADSVASDTSSSSFEQNAHHFIAFVPVGSAVWKLDGMDAQPTCVGTFNPEAGELWLDAASDTINALMAAGDDDYGVVALSQSPLKGLRRKAAETLNLVAHVEGRLEKLDSTWRNLVDDSALPSPRMLGIKSLLPLHPVPEAIKAVIEKEGLEELLNRRAMVVQELSDIAACLVEEMSTEAAEEEKARQRRFDSGPAIKVWLEMLAENGWLEGNLKRFM